MRMRVTSVLSFSHRRSIVVVDTIGSATSFDIGVNPESKEGLNPGRSTADFGPSAWPRVVHTGTGHDRRVKTAVEVERRGSRIKKKLAIEYPCRAFSFMERSTCLAFSFDCYSSKRAITCLIITCAG
jgi:hypothetical protein